MGKYIRKAKTAGPDLATAMESSLGVRTRTRAKTLACSQRRPPSPPPPAANYLQLRSRRLLLKPPISGPKRQRQSQNSRTPNPTTKVDALKEKEPPAEKSAADDEMKVFGKCDFAEASFGDNVMEFEGRDRGTRESTPCSLIRDPDVIRTPGSSTRPSTSLTGANRRDSPIEHRHIPTSNEMDEFFAGPEQEQQKSFVEKYNFDPVKDEPLPGRYEWEKLKPSQETKANMSGVKQADSSS